MSKKTIDTQEIANELRGASVFFPKKKENIPASEATIRPSDQSSERPSDHPTKRPSDHLSKKTKQAAKSRKRNKVIRIAFDLYEDQAKKIRKLRAERELLQGDSVSLSDIAREAFEKFFEGLEEATIRPNDQSSERPTDQTTDGRKVGC